MNKKVSKKLRQKTGRGFTPKKIKKPLCLKQEFEKRRIDLIALTKKLKREREKKYKKMIAYEIHRKLEELRLLVRNKPHHIRKAILDHEDIAKARTEVFKVFF